jgi:outer membrane lipopolysaccharide assembly protein LptE/RlpB
MMGGVMQLKTLALLVSAALLACGESLPDKPQIEPDRTAIWFPAADPNGAVWVGTTLTETLQLMNGGIETLNISELSIGGENADRFTVEVDKKSVESEQRAFVKLTFTPLEPGKHAAELTVVSNAENTPTLKIPLGATAVAPPAK